MVIVNIPRLREKPTDPLIWIMLWSWFEYQPNLIRMVSLIPNFWIYASKMNVSMEQQRSFAHAIDPLQLALKMRANASIFHNASDVRHHCVETISWCQRWTHWLDSKSHCFHIERESMSGSSDIPISRHVFCSNRRTAQLTVMARISSQ